MVLFFIQKALHLRSTRTFKDDKGVLHKNGEEWLITMADTEAHIPNVYEEVMSSGYSLTKYNGYRPLKLVLSKFKYKIHAHEFLTAQNDGQKLAGYLSFSPELLAKKLVGRNL